MLKISVNIVDDAAPASVRTTAHVEGGFIVAIMVEDDGKYESPVTFDTIALEILYNDGEYLIGSDGMARPIALELARETSIDAYSRVAVKGGRFSDPNGPFTNGSLLTLRPRTDDPIGPFRTTTGLAGIRDFEQPFVLNPEMGLVAAVGGRLYPAAGAISGTTNIVAVGHVFHRSRPVPYESVVGRVEILPVPGFSAGSRRHPDSHGN